MTLKILYFAGLRESIGTGAENIDLPPGVATVSALRDLLGARHPELLTTKNLRAAVGSSARPYGYTLATWTTGAVLINARGIPDLLAALMFMAGAVGSFAFVGTLAFGSMTKHFDRERGQALL